MSKVSCFDFALLELIIHLDMLSFFMAGSREYHNGKLESNTYYAVFQRSFDHYGSYSSEEFLRFKTKKSFPFVTVIVPVVVILVVIPVAVRVYFIGK